MLQLAVAARDPLASLDEDYAEAVVRLGWAVDRQTTARILLCAAVELLPREVPAPLLIGERHTTASRRYFLYATEAVVSARRGVTWFEDAWHGVAVRPGNDGHLGGADADAPVFVAGPFQEEPPSPSMVIARTRVPFAADWHGSVRVRHLVAERSPFVDWTLTERAVAVEWLRNELLVDVDVLPEYAGAIHLIAPNPVFRSSFVRDDSRDDARFALMVALTPRAGRSVVGLDLVIEERRPTGIGVLSRITLEGPLVRVEFPYWPEAIRERVFDAQRGLLYESNFSVFGVGLDLTVHTSSSVRRVQPPGPGSTYEVSLAGSHQHRSQVGKTRRSRGAASILFQASQDRARRARGDSDQRWFRNEAPDGVKALRELVAGAKGSVLICDPYFGGDDLLRVVLAIADPRTNVRVLASAMHLTGRHATGVTDAEYLARQLESALLVPPSNPISIRVMPGEVSPIHDRFLVTEASMWMLGTSLNNFGQRGTLMVIVPDRRPIEEELQRVWDVSKTLPDWLAARAGGGSP